MVTQLDGFSLRVARQCAPHFLMSFVFEQMPCRGQNCIKTTKNEKHSTLVRNPLYETNLSSNYGIPAIVGQCFRCLLY